MTDHRPDLRRLRALVAPYSKRIQESVVDPKQDLIVERKRASFSVERMSEELYGGVEALALRREVMNVMDTDPRLSKAGYHFSSREERIERAFAAYCAFPPIVIENGWSFEEGRLMQQFFAEACAFDLHWGMFVPTLRGQGTPDQQMRWMTPAATYNIIGTYCQTELVGCVG